MRGKFRSSWEHSEAMVPGKVDRNPQTFTDIPNAKPEGFKPATERVYHQAEACVGS